MSAGIADRSAEEGQADPAEPTATLLPGQPPSAGQTSECPGQPPASPARESAGSPAAPTPASPALQTAASPAVPTPASPALQTAASPAVPTPAAAALQTAGSPDPLKADSPARPAAGSPDPLKADSPAVPTPASPAARPDDRGHVPPLLSGLSAAAIMVAARWTRWLEPELLGLPSLVGRGSVCVDVGAAAGIYTLPLARLAGPTGLVHSVEPLPFAWPTWNRLVGVRTRPNVVHHAVALGSEPGEASMSVPRGRHGLVTGRSFVSQHCLGLGSNAEFAQHITYPVPVDTLDRLLAEAHDGRLDFVKIDVEGAELHVLRGGAAVIESFRPAMLIEIEARHTARYQYHPEDVVSWLRARGYAMYTWSRGWHQASQITSATRNYLFRVP